MFFEDLIKIDEKYSTKVSVPQYLPKHIKPNVSACYILTKYNELLTNIAKSNVSEDEKTFLRLAASRHIIFDYATIADYYAHSNKEMQELMEQSALVILDFNDAIANGYVELTKDIRKIIRRDNK